MILLFHIKLYFTLMAFDNYYNMRRNELDESLLSSSHYVMQDRHQPILQVTSDLNLERLYRKFHEALPQLNKENAKAQNNPFICPIIFSPQSKFIICWQILNIALIYLYFLQIPIILAFENHRSLDYNERFFQILNIPTIFVFLCSILINLNTSFYQDGLLRKDPIQIRNNYLKNTLHFDIISILAILIYQILEITKQFDNQSLKIFVVLFYLKFFELMNTENTMISSFDLNRRTKAALKLFLLLMKILLVCNAVACSAFYISYYLASTQEIYTPPPNPQRCLGDCFWVYSVEYAGITLFDYDDFTIQYIYSLYWASTTMISIGYGDITPKNPSEVGFTVFIQFLSCLLYGYSINSIWSIIQELNAKKFKIHSRLNLINLYMRDKEIGPELTSRVNAYLNNYYYAKNLRERDMEAEIINELTPALRKELFYQSYSIIFSHKYFSLANMILKVNICSLVKQVGYYEAEMVFSNELNKQPCLYYVKKGELKYITGGKSHTFIKNVYTNDLFGVYEFFSQLYFKSQLKATKYSLLFYLKVQDWRNALQNFSEDCQRYYQTKDQLTLYQNGGVISYKCEFCNLKTHRTEDCFDFQFRRIISQTIFLWKVQQNQRKYYPRREFKIHLHEKHERKRKYTLRNAEVRGINRQDGHHNSVLYQRSHHLEDSIRKSSIEEHFDKKGRTVIKNQKNKQQNLKALQKVRRQYSKADFDEVSNESGSAFDVKFEELNIDGVKQYENYYPNFNINELNIRDNIRRRMTRFP